jgi:hypothetical protein
MNASQPRRIDRRTAEQLLAGAPAGSDAGHDRLTRLLAAVSAPGRDSELAGEDMAVAAFTAERIVPVAKSRRGQMIKSPLAKILTIKVLGIAAACGTAGGVALAASAGAFTGTTPVSPSAHTSGSVSNQAASSVTTHNGASADKSGGQGAAGAAGATAATVGQLTDLCTKAADQVATLKGALNTASGQVLSVAGLDQALASSAIGSVLYGPAFGSLTQTVGHVTEVPDYCALLLDLPKLPEPALAGELGAGALAKLPLPLIAKLHGSVLAELPVWYLVKLPVHVLAELPVWCLAKLPAHILAELPASVLSGLPGSVLAGLPTSVLGGLPTSALSQLPVPVLSQLPVPVLSQLSPSVLNGLPASTLQRLPVPVLSQLSPSALSGLPVPVLSQLPSSVLARLPVSVLRQLPTSVLSGLPAPVLSQLGL